MKVKITEVKSRIEIVREIKPFSIENVIEEKEVIDSKIRIAEQSKLWLEHQKEHPTARLRMIGVSEAGLFDQKKYVTDISFQTRQKPAEEKKIKEETPTPKKQVILAGCNCGMVLEIGANKKGEGYVRTYEPSALHATANEYGVASLTEGQKYGTEGNNTYKENGAGYKG